MEFWLTTESVAAWVLNSVGSPTIVIAPIIAVVITFFQSVSLYRLRRLRHEVRERAKSLESYEARQEERTKRAGAAGPSQNSAIEIPAPVPPVDLVKACVAETCVLFAGPSLQPHIGGLTNVELLSQLIEVARGTVKSVDWDALDDALAEGKIDSVKDVLGAHLPASTIRSTLEGAIQSEAIDEESAKLLVNIPFSGVISSALDRAIDHAFEKRMPRPDEVRPSDVPGLIQSASFFMFKATGSLEGNANLVFTSAEHRQLLSDNQTIGRFLSSVFTRNTVLFAGSRVEEIEQFIIQSNIRANTDRTHYALVPHGHFFQLDSTRLLKLYQVQLLGYDPQDSDAIAEFIRKLQHEVAASGDSASKKRRAAPRIDAVRLVNIGPFEDLEVRFSERWTVLLGNNGCGKSSVLRAIALVMCGEDDRVRPLAARLLREGTDRGYVELSSGMERYRTDLIREKNRVLVRAAAQSPLQTGEWVVLGFPAVRGIPMASTTSNTERYQMPLPDDVLPLLGNGLDPRMQELHEWIRLLNAKSEDKQVARAERNQAKKLRNAIFKLIDGLTPGFMIRWARYDHDSSQIYVSVSTEPDEAVDQQIPLSFLSQGISSTIGWAGILLARLHDIHPNSPNPAQEHGLLLVDEIDSHLHPEWQQIIVGKLRELFPNLNVIATSHSPLVVAALHQREVVRFLRDGTVETLEQSYDGYRADQILTDTAFGLTTTRNPEAEKFAKPLRDKFVRLARKAKRTSEEDRQLLRIAHQLDGRIASSGETPAEREATAQRVKVLQDIDTPNFDPASAFEQLLNLDDEAPKAGEP